MYDKCTKHLQIILKTTRSRSLHLCLLVSRSPKLSHFPSKASCFRVDSIISRQVYRMTPKIDLKHLKVKGTPYTVTSVLNFNSFPSKTSRFQVGGQFEKSAPNDPKMVLSTLRLKVPHIHVTSTPESQISPRFTRRPVGFEL